MFNTLKIKFMIKKTLKVILITFALTTLYQTDINAQGYIRISKSDGSILEISVSEIQNISFSSILSADEQKLAYKALINLKIFPYPASDIVNISYNLTENGDVQIEIYNTNGDLVSKNNVEYQKAGDYNYKWNIFKMSAGTYICKVKQNNNIVAEKIIINK